MTVSRPVLLLQQKGAKLLQRSHDLVVHPKNKVNKNSFHLGENTEEVSVCVCVRVCECVCVCVCVCVKCHVVARVKVLA